MKRGAITLLSIGGSLILVGGTSAITAESPYKSIVERNVFSLKEPPPAVRPEDLAAKAPPNIFLTGITTVFGNKRALLKATQPASKPGEKPVDETYMLTEGQREGDVEVVQIDEVKGMVKIRLAGKELDLDFDKNGVKISAAPVSAPPPGTATPLPGFPLRPLGTTPGANPPPVQPLGTSFRSSSASGNSMARPMRMGGNVGGYAGTPSVPGGLNFGGYSSTTPTTQPQQTAPILSTEEQVAVMVAESQANANNPKYPPPPPPVAAIVGGDTSSQPSSSQSQQQFNPVLPPMPPGTPGK